MARKGENIYKRKDGRWEARYIRSHEDGKAVYGYVYGRSYREVREKRFHVLSHLKESESLGYAGDSVKQACLRHISTIWLDSLRLTRKESTLVKYKNQLDKHILPEFGDQSLAEISNEKIIAFSNHLLRSHENCGKGLSTKSVSDIISRIYTIRKFALIHGYDVGFVPDCVMIPQKQKSIRVLSFDEEKTLLQYLKNNPDLTNLGIMLCLFTGIRIGELCALTWRDISLEDRELNVRRTMQRLQKLDNRADSKTYISIDEPKSKCSIRTIPIPESIMNSLHSAYLKDAYILTGSCSSFVEPRTMENRFKAVLNKCKIEDANFHALRHTFATRCVEVGFDIKSLSEILGHANVNITLNRYVHPTMKLKRENMDKLSTLFSVQ